MNAFSPTSPSPRLAGLLLAGILLAGLALRLALSPHKGFEFDVTTNEGWGRGVVITGVAQAYREQPAGVMIPNYPPFALMLFGATQYAYSLADADFEKNSTLARIFVKIPSILADLLLAALVFVIVRRIRDVKAGLLAAIIATSHPAIWFESAVWGQTDVLYTLFSLLAMWLLVGGRFFLGGALAAIALLTKFQAIMFFPLLFVLALAQPRKIPRSILGAVAAIIPVILPFALAGTWMDVVDVLAGSVGDSTNLSLNAYNVWWALFTDTARSVQDTELVLGPISYRWIGIALSGAFYALSLAWLAVQLRKTNRYKDRIVAAMAAASVCSYAFFLFNTEMHERYLFPLMVFGLPLIFAERRFVWPYVAASTLFFWNLLGVLQLSDWDHALYVAFPALDGMIATLQVVTFFVFAKRVLLWRVKIPSGKDIKNWVLRRPERVSRTMRTA